MSAIGNSGGILSKEHNLKLGIAPQTPPFLPRRGANLTFNANSFHKNTI